jgi:FlaA1/EpsC-like NDP-sugar epimerase
MNLIEGRRILITGGTGSLGTALVTRLLTGCEGEPKSITVFSRDELKQADMKAQFHDDRLHFIVGDVRNYEDVLYAVGNADILFNAAALKRVEVCEKFPDQAIATNYMGASNIVRAIREHNLPVQAVVNVGSDKGCAPLNVYGATKSLQEARLLAANSECPNTRFIGVRYGNVMASRGSVIPIWLEQSRQHKPLTITNPNMTRFLISLNQAVDTLLNALNYALAGEIFIPQLPAARIGDMARIMANGNGTLVTGSGPGEKMHEILVTKEEAEYTHQRAEYYVINRSMRPLDKVIDGEYISCNHLISNVDLTRLFVMQGLVKVGAVID